MIELNLMRLSKKSTRSKMARIKEEDTCYICLQISGNLRHHPSFFA